MPCTHCWRSHSSTATEKFRRLDEGRRGSAEIRGGGTLGRTNKQIAATHPMLAKYDAARKALAAAHQVDEVKDLRDQAQAIAAYARQARDTEMVQWATEIKVRAERRCGQLLAEMEKAKGNQHVNSARSHNATEQPKTLAEIGVTKDQSSRYQKLAAIPEDHFETAIETAKATVGEVTSAHMRRLASELAETRDLNERLAKARRDLDPVSRSNNAWHDFVIRMRMMHELVEKEMGPVPKPTPKVASELQARWSAITNFLSAHLES